MMIGVDAGMGEPALHKVGSVEGFVRRGLIFDHHSH